MKVTIDLPDDVSAALKGRWELTRSSTPNAVRDWLSHPPPWLRVMPVENERVQQVSDELDMGERAAIAPASVIHADLLLIDEAAGRVEAKRRKLRVDRKSVV